MLNSLRRLVDRDRAPRAQFAAPPTYAVPRDIPAPDDDYHVEGDDEPLAPSVGARMVQAGQMVLILVLAVLSLAVFWLIGLILNIF
jgi:hypothetical protein